MTEAEGCTVRSLRYGARVILLLHNRYRTLGGEERAVADLAWLIPHELGEDAEVLERDSASLSGADAARGLLRGGLRPEEVAAAVRRTGARVVHAHNVNPAFGWRALAAARGAGARVVLHLHNYRLVCANGICFTHGEDCVRCHGRWTAPGVRLNCRGGSVAESAVYGAALAGWQRRLCAQVDRFVVPSAFALSRLRDLGAPVGERVSVVPSVQRWFAPASAAGAGEFVLFAGRVAEEKGVLDAVAACRAAELPLVVAGDGPVLGSLRGLAGVEALGRLEPAALDALRRRAGAAIVPSRYAEILPLAALEAMAAGVPVVATRAGGLAEAVPAEGLADVGDVAGLAARLRALWRDRDAGARAIARAREMSAPAAVAARLREVYAA
jgi:glycosyltransferase involved in cell wall biosynthesis